MEDDPKWQECGKWQRFFSHYYTIVAACFVLLAYHNASATLQGLYGYGFLNPAKFLIHPNNTNAVSVTPLNWTQANLQEIELNVLMRGIVIGSCPAVVLTQLVGWGHIIRHMLRIKNSASVKLKDNEMRDKAIQIMFLPVIYSIVAYSNVIRLMNLFTGAADLNRPEWTLPFSEKKAYTVTLYEASLSMADFYEAVSLLHFTTLTVSHIRKTFLVALQDRDKKLSRSFTHIEKNDPVIRVTDVMSGLVTSGVYSFCLTCFLTFAQGLRLVYHLASTEKVMSDEGSVPAMLSGAGLIASTVAIGNVVNVELAFHHELEKFVPGKKFWSTKVIVSIAFIQEALLGLLGSDSVMPANMKLSDLQIKLLYCSLLCYEVLVVALLHVMAWPAGVNITPEEREVDKAEGEYWDETPDTPNHVDAREPLLCVE